MGKVIQFPDITRKDSRVPVDMRTLQLKEWIETGCQLYCLNLTVYDGKIAFVDQEQRKIVAVWNPQYKLSVSKEDK